MVVVFGIHFILFIGSPSLLLLYWFQTRAITTCAFSVSNHTNWFRLCCMLISRGRWQALGLLLVGFSLFFFFLMIYVIFHTMQLMGVVCCMVLTPFFFHPFCLWSYGKCGFLNSCFDSTPETYTIYLMIIIIWRLFEVGLDKWKFNFHSHVPFNLILLI